MKVTVRTLTPEESDRWDSREALNIYIDNKIVFHVSDGEPEDSNLSRDFKDCWKIPSLMNAAYEAGKNNEDFEISYEETTLDEI